MNNDTKTMNKRSGELRQSAADRQRDARLDEELRTICLRVMALMDQDLPEAGMHNPRQMMLFIANRYAGKHPGRFDHLCRGLHQVAQKQFRDALFEFETVLTGRVEPEFEILRELALQAHAWCLEQLDYDDEAMVDFTRLLHRKFRETRDYGEPDHVARMLGLGGGGLGLGRGW